MPQIQGSSPRPDDNSELWSGSDQLQLTIPEVDLVDEIDDFAVDYARRHGREPVQISHWDPSSAFVARLAERIRVPPLGDPIPYRYSYLIDLIPVVAAKLGLPDAAALQLTENGSCSIASVANWLALSGITRVQVLRPSYFTVAYALRRFGLDVSFLPAIRSPSGYGLPSTLDVPAGTALWVTNPIYNTGEYGLLKHVDQFQRILDAGGTVIADEALALAGRTLGSHLAENPHFIGIYTPHKAICVNGLKFSAIACNRRRHAGLEHWADVLSGGLSVSAEAAIAHFASDEFDAYAASFLALLSGAREWHASVLAQFAPQACTDPDTAGHFLTVYFRNISGTVGADSAFLKDLVEASGAVLIPGLRSGFDPNLGFSFRINLAQDRTQFRAAVSRLYRVLSAR